MKGFLLSCFVFAVCVVFTIVLLRTRRPRRPAGTFFAAFGLCIPLYFVLYAGLPADLWILSPDWQLPSPMFDAAWGFVILALNWHSFLDFFFAVNGGFSACLLLELLRNREQQLTGQALAEQFRTPDGRDKIYGWRLPRLVETGYLATDPAGDSYRLTPKGRRMARLAAILKRLLAIEEGG